MNSTSLVSTFSVETVPSVLHLLLKRKYLGNLQFLEIKSKV